MGESELRPNRSSGIVSPLSRHLSVADLERSVAFYRDVLGFEVHLVPTVDGVPATVEAVRGPARIQFGTQDTAYDSTGQPRPRGAAILFFETDDVEAMRAAVRAGGGAPSELENVNWIKMRMFAIRDPDGHTLWFGQSFQQPDPARNPHRQLRKALPELPLDDVSAGVAYYCDVLGFKVNYAGPEIGVMDRDAITILLIARTAKHHGIGSCYVYVHNVDALHAELVAKGANVQGDPVSQPWGLRDFQVLDLEGNRITFGQPFE
jgi:catechol 2,3-dioxygenase-like lactoylglutathione lyase family enzyme